MRLLLCSLVLFVWACNVNAQNSQVDSLKKLLDSTTIDSTKIDLLIELGINLSTNSPSDAIDYLNSAEKIAYRVNDSSRLAISYNRLGVVYYYISDYTKALEYYIKSYNINQAIGNEKNLANNYNNIGLVYYQTKQYREALYFTNHAVVINKKWNNRSSLAQNYNNIGIIYRALGKRDSALMAYNQSLDINEKLQRTQSLVYNYNNLGNIYLDNKDYSSAISCFQKALKLNEKSINLHEKALILNNIANTSILLGQYDYAEKSIIMAYKIIKQINSKDLEIENLKYRIDLYSRVKNYRRAIEIYNIYDLLKDSLWAAEQFDQISKFKLLNETEKKDREITLLKTRNALQKAQLDKQRVIKISLIIFIIIGLIVVLLSLWIYKLKSQANKYLKMLADERQAKQQKAKDVIE